MSIKNRSASRPSSRVRIRLALLGLANLAFASASMAGVCTTTANLTLQACGHAAQEDLLMSRAKCLQTSDNTARNACVAEAKETLKDDNEDCDDQHTARLAVCAQVGEGPYEPDFSPDLFDSDYHALSNPNPYYPLTIGNTWEFKSADELNTVAVLDQTKRIEGLDCVVVHDQVFLKATGALSEDTNDWFCQARNRDVYYLGEETKDYETFDGDKPRLPELVDIEGSFKSGRDHNKGGIVMLGAPHAGVVYFEEFALGDAEDLAKVLTAKYKFGVNASLDYHVPKALADYFCGNGDCIVTRNTSQLEPDVIERKYYARGIGVFLETAIGSSEVVRLTNCNFDTRCDSIPQP